MHQSMGIAIATAGYAIRGLDYLRIRKQGKLINNEGKKQILAKSTFWEVGNFLVIVKLLGTSCFKRNLERLG